MIKGQLRPPHLALVTTTSALGRSSIYNRLSFRGRKVFQSLGFTKGYGHFHFTKEVFGEIRAFLEEMKDPIVRMYRYGQGPNWRYRVLEKGLRLLASPMTSSATG